MQVLKKIWRVFGGLLTVVLAILLICNLYSIVVRYIAHTPQPSVFGWSWAVVISGSMEPEISVNDLIVVHKEDNYEIGDVITYENGNSVVTHRIVDKNDEEFITKGDFNNTQDLNPVSKNAVVGKVVFVIPKIGLFIEYLRTPLGMTCMVLIGLLLIEIPYLWDKGESRIVSNYL